MGDLHLHLHLPLPTADLVDRVIAGLLTFLTHGETMATAKEILAGYNQVATELATAQTAVADDYAGMIAKIKSGATFSPSEIAAAEGTLARVQASVRALNDLAASTDPATITADAPTGSSNVDNNV